MNKGGVLRDRVRLSASGVAVVALFAVMLLAGCGGGGGSDRFTGLGNPPAPDPTSAERPDRTEAVRANPEFANQTDARLAQKVAPSELERINAHHAYGWTLSGTSLLDETGDISGFGIHIGIGGVGLEHNHGKVFGQLFQSPLPYPEEAFQGMRTTTTESEEFSYDELLADIEMFESIDIDAIEEDFDARKEALVRSLTAKYEAIDGYPEMVDVHEDYIIHISDIRDLTDDEFDDQKRLELLRAVLDQDNPEANTVADAVDTEDASGNDNFLYIEEVCTDKSDYRSASSGSCLATRRHFVDFGNGTPDGRQLRLIPDFSQRLQGSQAPGLVVNGRNRGIADLPDGNFDALTELLELSELYPLDIDENDDIDRVCELLNREAIDCIPPGEVLPALLAGRIDELLNTLGASSGTGTQGTDSPEMEEQERQARIAGLLTGLRLDLEARPVHGVAFGSRLVPHIAHAGIKIECSAANEETTGCLAPSDISGDPRTDATIDYDTLLAEYIEAIPGPSEEAADTSAGGNGVIRAVDVFLLDMVVEGNGIAQDKELLDDNFDETLDALEDFFLRRNNPVMVVRSGYDGFEGVTPVGTVDTAVRGPRTLAALPYHYERCTRESEPVDCRNFRGHLLTAVALNIDNNGLHENSPRCGGLPSDWNEAVDGRHYCLAAPGDRLRINGKVNDDGSIDLTRGYRNDGESTQDNYQPDLGAAAFVAGSLAVLSERFREQVPGHDLARRLVDTANQQIFFDDETLLTNTPRPTQVEIDNPEMADEVQAKMDDRYEAVLQTYGAGLIDLEEASEARGEQTVRISATSVEGNSPALSPSLKSTTMTSSEVFGAGLASALRSYEIATFDEWNAPFWHPLSSLVSITTSRRSLLERRGDVLASPARFTPLQDGGLLAAKVYSEGGLFQDNRGSDRWAERYREDGLAQEYKLDISIRQPVDGVDTTELLLAVGEVAELPLGLNAERDFMHPYLHLVGDGIGAGGSMALGPGRITVLGFSGSREDNGDEAYAAHGGLLEYVFAPSSSLTLGVQSGAFIEEERGLGLRSRGAFGKTESVSTAFVGVSMEGRLNAVWRFRAQALGGRTNLPEPSAGLIANWSGVATSAFRVGFEGRGVLQKADKFAFFVDQPLRVESGSVDFVVPVGRTQEGDLVSRRISGVSLAPDGRELEVYARYEFDLAKDLALGFGAGAIYDGGHIKARATEIYGLGDLRFGF